MRWYRAAQWVTATAVFAGIAAIGCNNQSGSKGGSTKNQATPPANEPMRAPDKMGSAPAQTDNSKSTAKATPAPAPTKTVQAPLPARNEPKPQPVKETEPTKPVVSAEPKPKPPPAPMSQEQELEQKRGQAEDMIYATIRVKMEEAIAERAKLLKEGKDPSDERVRQLEGTIMRARSLLMENGEIVADVDPPIVQVQK